VKAFLLACVLLSSSPNPAGGQGLVKFSNSAATLVSSLGTPISGPSGSCYFALLTAPVGTTDPALFTFSGVYATNTSVAGRLQGGSNLGVAVPGWGAGTFRAFRVCGWPSSMGHDWNPAWASGGVSSSGIAAGRAGGTDPNTGESFPPLALFSSATINVGFDIITCLGPYWYGITQSPASQTVNPGDTAVFSVSAMACPQPYFQWYFNGAPIPGANNAIYRITNVQPANGGTYFAELWNPAWPFGAGSTRFNSGSATLTVRMRPMIVQQPSSQTAEAGSDARFSLRAEGSAPLIYQWLFNGTNLGAPSTDAFLSLTNVQPAQAGPYQVVVTNNAGMTNSSQIMLSVIPPVPRRVVPALAMSGQPSTTANLESTPALGSGSEWSLISTVSLTTLPEWYFDLTEPLPPRRLYRAWQIAGVLTPPALELHMVTAISLTGALGSSVQIDYINQFGPTDAWVALATVTLTNTSQLYFDISAVAQPPRLYRLLSSP
jgi:hypothetical protein